MSPKDREQESSFEARRAQIAKKSRHKLAVFFTMEVLKAADPELGTSSAGQFTTYDISRAGLSFFTDWPFQVGDQLRLVLQFPGAVKPEEADGSGEESESEPEPEPVLVEVGARVANLKPGKHTGVGLEFLDLTAEQSERLKEFLKPTFKVKY